ncbi:MAG: S9 family peptidase [Thermoanaerobaculia bacterium]
MRRSIFGIGCLAASVLAAQPADRPFSLDDLARLRTVSDPQISPDGARVAYVVASADLEKDRNDSDIWMTGWDGKETVRLTTSKDSESTPRWSPDGRYLAFLSDRGDEAEEEQLWLLPLGGGEAEKLTDVKGGVEDYDWSPDGKRLVLVVNDPDPDAGPDKGKGSDGKKAKKPIVIDRFQFKLDEHGYLGKRRSHLFLLDREARKAEPLTSGGYNELMPAWSPDGKCIAFVSKRGEDPDRTDNWDLYAIEPRAGAVARALTTYEGADNQPDWDSRPAWSPDSRSIAYIQGGPDKLIYYAVHKLAVVPAAGGPARVLTADLDRNVSSPRFAAGGAAILFIVEDDQAVHLAKMPSAGGPIERLVTGRRVVPAFSASGNGRIAILSGTPQSPNEVYAAGAAGEPRRLSRQNDGWLAEVRLGAVEETSFQSKDGTEIHGFLVKPPDFEAGRRYPAVLRIHGGPVGQFENVFAEDWQWFASNGYVVIAANPRGSSGRGEKFQSAIYADWGHRDTEDVLAAVDDAIRRGIADPDRLAVGGWSYGGMLTNYVIASTTRFRAATSGAGISNIFTGYGTDQYVREYEQELGPPWKNREAWLKVSYPFFHADRIQTPTLFLCGQDDFNVPLINSEQMYQALRSQGVPTQLVIYPDQYHGIDKPSYVRDRLERYVAWCDKYAKPGKAAAAGASVATH